MNWVSPKQVVATQRAGIDTVLGVTQTLLDGCERLTDLNWQTAGSLIGESHERAWRGALPKTPLQWMMPASAWPMPVVEKAQGYYRKAYEIAVSTQADIAGISREGSDAYTRLFADDGAKPASSEWDAGMSAWGAVFDAAFALYETWQKANLQAVQLTAGSLDPAMIVAGKSAKRTSEHARH
ncbi:TIGR01841 family phasin [Trinickia diaoshuihuensis]|jgi:phasin family protein|uniref:TIGR01841 family phasin n=1 Tax=Trinickia diaoshuihuensis TaxID=2292265 RepID=UPI000E2738D6|nr:TIGR01841 family phasin [Trinickia diaoshuihuensis]